LIDEHANAVCLVAADSGQYTIIISQNDVSVVAKHWRIAVNCRVARKRLVAGISRLEATGCFVILAQGKRPRNAPTAGVRVFQRRARLIHDPAHKVSTPRLLGALAELSASGLRLEFSLCQADNFLASWA
jgi:hypothetical protein